MVLGVVETASLVLLAGCLPHAEVERVPEARRVPGLGASALPASFPASDVLRRWDRARASAFAAGDVEALRRLYVEGSAAGTSDARLLKAYLRSGLRVEGMRMQLLSLEVLHEDAARLRLLVTDRLTGAVAVGQGSRSRLPRDQASTRVVELRRTRGVWRVATVRESWQRRAAR